MGTKGISNLYGNAINGKKGKPTEHINYPYASSFLNYNLKGHYERHGESVGAISEADYASKAIKFANFIDRKNCGSVVDGGGTTYKYNKKSKELVLVDKDGTIITYYKITSKKCKFNYIDGKGKSKCVEF